MATAMRNAPKSPHSDDDVEVLRNYETEKKISSAEGKIELAGCKLFVPPNSVADEVVVKMRIDFVKRKKQYLEDKMMLFGPELNLGPDGTRFSLPIAFSVPTCYSSAKGEKVEVEVQTKENATKQWEKCQMATISMPDGNEQRYIEFELNHFSPYRFLMQMLGMKKGIAHMSFIRQNDDDGEYEMIWCFCDNLRETKLDVQKQMILQEYNLVKGTGTFMISPTDYLQVSIEIGGCEIEDPVRMIHTDDIWFSDSVVQKEFTIRNLENGKKINYKIEFPGGESKQNSFTFRRNTGEMNPGPTIINIIKPQVETLNL